MFFSSKSVAFGLLAMLLACSKIKAQSSKNLDEVIVTANKFPQKQTQTGRIVTVLNDSLLRANSGKSLSDVLSQQAGIFIVGSQQPLGSLQTVFTRGAGSGYTLFLIDGIPVYDPSSIEGNFDLNLLSINQIARIEILKGGQSTLYGSDAVAGVINIITQQPQVQKTTTSGSISAGSYGTFKANFGLNSTIGKTAFQFQLGAVSSRGFSSAYDNSGKDSFEKDGFKQNNFRGSIKHEFTKNFTAKIWANLSKYRTDLDAGAFVDDKDYVGTTTNKQLGLGLEYALKKGRILLNYHRNSSERTYTNDSTFVPATAFSKFDRSYYGSVSHFTELYSNIELTDNLELVIGADYRVQNTDQTYLSVSDFGNYESPAIVADKANINILSGYGSLILKKSEGFGAEIGGRFNYHSVYGSNFTYNVNPYFWVNSRLKLLVSLASSFKAPSLYHLYSPYGNLNLKPETASTLDAGIQFFGRKQQNFVRVVYFQRAIDNVIFFKSLSKEPYGQYINFNQQNDKGLEFEAIGQHKKWHFSANYTYLTGAVNTKNISGKDTIYNNLFRRPKNVLNLSLGYDLSAKFVVNASLRSVGERKDLFFNDNTYQTENVNLAAYTTLDLYAQYRPSKGVTFFADFRNITNQQFFDLVGYTTRRFNFMAGLVFEY